MVESKVHHLDNKKSIFLINNVIFFPNYRQWIHDFLGIRLDIRNIYKFGRPLQRILIQWISPKHHLLGTK